MNSRYFWITCILLGMAYSCKGPEGVPTPAELPYDGMGAYIRIENHARQFVKGELIASNEQGVYVLTEKRVSSKDNAPAEKELLFITRQEIRAFTLHYAQGKNQNWRIPVYTLGTLSHGWWLIFTLPLNLIATSAVAHASLNEYSLRNKEISVDDLWRYARYPQGLPSQVSPESIR